MLITFDLFLEIRANKNTEYLILILIMKCKCHKVYEDYIKFNSIQRKKHRKTKKEIVSRKNR